MKEVSGGFENVHEDTGKSAKPDGPIDLGGGSGE